MKASDIRPGGDHADGGALEGLRYIRHRQALAHGGEQHQHQGKSHRGAEAVEQGLQEAVLLVDVQQGHTQHRAVGGDQGQVDPQNPVQQGAGFAHHHLGELHHHGDHQDEGDGLQVAQAQRLQQEVVGQVAAGGGQGEDEGGGHGHAHGGLQLVGDTHERAQPQELYQHEVVDQDRPDQQDGIVRQHDRSRRVQPRYISDIPRMHSMKWLFYRSAALCSMYIQTNNH